MNSINNIIRRLRENRILQEKKEYDDIPRDELISLAQDGDQLALETLINTHHALISKMAYSKFTQSGDQDDMKQLATIGFWEAIQSYNPKRNGDFEAYAGMIMKRRLTDELRKEDTDKRRANSSTTSLDATEDTPDDSEYLNTMTQGEFRGLLRDTGGSAEDEVIGKEGEREILKFIRDKLSQQEQNAVMMYIKGYKVSDIAEETGMKYKSVENALMRVKNKLADYLRTRESKKITEDKIEFSEEEKKILESVLNKIDAKRALRESAVASMKDSYEEYTELQLDDELSDIKEELEDIVEEMKNTDYDDRDELLDQLDDLSYKLSAMEDYLTDEQYKESEDILMEINRAEDTEYAGDRKPKDPYTERGLKRSDFY